ncbi:hypothetical protein [Kushneria aurantia]|uniref:Uncharacterized protein n=1 Tax=Kushneria aurantia TaxID=504092 RepID=A0ABV6G2S4_9GAMM
MDPHIAVKREVHHTPPLERFTEPMPLAEGSSPTERMSQQAFSAQYSSALIK